MGIYYTIMAVILLACVLMVLIVLVQNSKGGGLASNLQGQNQFMGVRKTADFLEKATWTIAIVIAVLSLVSVFVIPRKHFDPQTTDTQLRETIEREGQQNLPAVDFQPQPTEATQTDQSSTTETPQE
ncbi:MAG: preprotein translocase subunit SecG [Bacteroidales bacterium]|jgi:preprotein translocase subunit SecG